jgi:hypothetical protein
MNFGVHPDKPIICESIYWQIEHSLDLAAFLGVLLTPKFVLGTLSIFGGTPLVIL